ncbi:MAG TPA: hypothetical protein VH107_01945 [Lacipirellulaceae bacterium]|nr:hypothetical protein [Lacipirellulaceae bacterium]
MDRFHARFASANRIAATLIGLALIAAYAGCSSILATGMYVFDGGNMSPADFDGLKSSRVVVMCKPPSSSEFRHAGAARSIAARTSELLSHNVKGIDIVSPREVDNWSDENDGGDFRELAKAVHADKVVYIQLDDFELYKGKTLYQGRADVTVTIYDMKDHNKVLWDKHLGEVLYPTNSGIPAQDKPVQQFEREFVDIVASRAATFFYKHDPNEMFAEDAMANR